LLHGCQKNNNNYPVMSFPEVAGNCYDAKVIPSLDFLNKMTNLDFAADLSVIRSSKLKEGKLCTLYPPTDVTVATTAKPEVVKTRCSDWEEIKKLLVPATASWKISDDGKRIVDQGAKVKKFLESQGEVKLSKEFNLFATKTAQKLYHKYVQFQGLPVSKAAKVDVAIKKMILMEEDDFVEPNASNTTSSGSDIKDLTMAIEVGMHFFRPVGGNLFIQQKGYLRESADDDAKDRDHVCIPGPASGEFRSVLFDRCSDHYVSKLTKGKRLIFTFDVADSTAASASDGKSAAPTVDASNDSVGKSTLTLTVAEKKDRLAKFSSEAKAKGFDRLAILCVHDYTHECREKDGGHFAASSPPMETKSMTTDELRGFDNELYNLMIGAHVPTLLPLLTTSSMKCYHSDLKEMMNRSPFFDERLSYVGGDWASDDEEQTYKRKASNIQGSHGYSKRTKTTATEEIDREIKQMISTTDHSTPSVSSVPSVKPNLTSMAVIPALKEDPNYRLGKTLFIKPSHTFVKLLYCDEVAEDNFIHKTMALVVPL
jgi:hypothetical protein